MNILTAHSASSWMISPCMLTRAAQILRTLSILCVRLMGTVWESIFEHLVSFDNSLNMYTYTLAILLVIVTSLSDSWPPFWVKAGMARFTFLSYSRSQMVKPLSSITSSPGLRYSRKPEFWVMNLSLHLPSYAGEINIMSPHGAMATKYLRVLLE